MKKRMMLCNIIIIVVGFVAAFLTATLLVQNQYEREFTSNWIPRWRCFLHR